MSLSGKIIITVTTSAGLGRFLLCCNTSTATGVMVFALFAVVQNEERLPAGQDLHDSTDALEGSVRQGYLQREVELHLRTHRQEPSARVSCS